MAETDLQEFEPPEGARENASGVNSLAFDAPKSGSEQEGGFDPSAFDFATRRAQWRHTPRVSTQEEAEKIPPGMAFIGPDGERRVVPYKVMQPSDLNDVPDGADFVGPDGELRTKPQYQGIDFTAQYLYNVAHSYKGRRKALERSYPGKVRDDPAGGFFVEDEDGVLRKPGRGAAASGGGIASAAAPTVLGIGGAIGGGLAGGIPGVAGAFAGGAAGSKANDIVSSLAGVYDDENSWRDAAIEGGLSAGGQVIGRYAGPVVKRAGEAISSGKAMLPSIANDWLGTNAEKLRAAIPLSEKGATKGEGLAGKLGFQKAGTEVPPSQMFPESPAIQNIVEFKEGALHTQDPLRMSREAHYERSIGEILEGVGVGAPMSRTEIDKTFKELVAAHEAGNIPLVEKLENILSKANVRSTLHPDAAVSIEKAGKAIQAKLAEMDQRTRDLLDLRRAEAERGVTASANAEAGRIAELQRVAEESDKAAQSLVNQGMADLDRQAADALRIAKAGHGTGDLHRNIAGQLEEYRTGIQARAHIMYDTADELTGAVRNPATGIMEGGARVNVEGLAPRAQAFLNQVPEEFERKYPTIVQRIRALGNSDEVPTWVQLRNLRTDIRQNIKWDDLSSDVENGTFKYFNNRVNEILTASNPETKEAVAALRRADDFYRTNMGPLGNRQIQNLMDGIKGGMGADPKAVLDMIMKEGRSDVARKIESIVGESTWNAVRAADTQEMIQTSRDIMGKVDSKKFVAKVLDRHNHGLLETLHGPQAAKLIKQAQNIEQLAGRQPISAQPGDTVADVIMRAHAAAEAAEVAAKQDPLKTLAQAMSEIQKEHATAVKAAEAARPLALSPTVGAHAAVDHILASPDTIIAASRAFPGGENSPQFQLLREVWTQRFLERSRTNLRPSKQLATTPPEIQELMFPGVTLKQMHMFAKEMELLVPSGADRGGKGIMRTNIQENPLGQVSGAGKLIKPVGKMVPGANMITRKLLGDYYALVRHIATSPTTLRWLEKGLTSSDPVGREEARAALRAIAQKSGIVGAGAGAAVGTFATGADENE